MPRGRRQMSMDIDIGTMECAVNGKYVDVTTGEQFSKNKLMSVIRAQNRASMHVITSTTSPISLCNHGTPEHNAVKDVTVDNVTVAVHASTASHTLYTVCDVGFGRLLTGPDAADMQRVAREVTSQSVRVLVDHGCWPLLTAAVTGGHVQKATYTMTDRMYGETKREVAKRCPFGHKCIHGQACTKSARIKCDQAIKIITAMRADSPRAALTSTAPMTRRYNAIETMNKLRAGNNRMDMTGVYTHMNTIRSVMNPELSRKHGKAIYLPMRRSGYVLAHDELFVDIDLPPDWDHAKRCAAKLEIIDKLLNDKLPVAWVLDTEHGLHVHLRLTTGVTEAEFHQLTKLLQAYIARGFSQYVDPACSDDVRLFKMPFCDSTDPYDMTHGHYICTPVVIGRPATPKELTTLLTTADREFTKQRTAKREQLEVKVCKHGGKTRVNVNGKKYTPITAEDAAARRECNDTHTFTKLQLAVYNLDVHAVAKLINVNIVDDELRTPVKRVEFDRMLLDKLDAVALLESSGERRAASDYTYADNHWSMTVYADRHGKPNDAWRVINHAKCTVSTLLQYLMAFTGQPKQAVSNFLCALAGIKLTDAPTYTAITPGRRAQAPAASLSLTPAAERLNDEILLEHGALDGMIDDLASVHGVTYLADPAINKVAHAVVHCMATAARNHYLQPAWMRSLPLEQQQIMCVIDYIREGHLRMYNEPVTKDKVIEVLRFMLAAKLLYREERGAFCHLNLERRVPGHVLMCVLGMRSMISADNQLEVIAAAKTAQVHADQKPVYAWTWAYVNTWTTDVATPMELRTGIDMATAKRLYPSAVDVDVSDELRKTLRDVHNDAQRHHLPVTDLALVQWCTNIGMNREWFSPGQLARKFTSWQAIMRAVQNDVYDRMENAVECAEQLLLIHVAVHWAKIGRRVYSSMIRVNQNQELDWRMVA